MPDIVLKSGINKPDKATPIIKAISDISIDSVKNWPISCVRVEPTTFLSPTSLARLADFAVDRFTKLKKGSKLLEENLFYDGIDNQVMIQSQHEWNID